MVPEVKSGSTTSHQPAPGQLVVRWATHGFWRVFRPTWRCIQIPLCLQVTEVSDFVLQLLPAFHRLVQLFVDSGDTLWSVLGFIILLHGGCCLAGLNVGPTAVYRWQDWFVVLAACCRDQLVVWGPTGLPDLEPGSTGLGPEMLNELAGSVSELWVKVPGPRWSRGPCRLRQTGSGSVHRRLPSCPGLHCVADIIKPVACDAFKRFWFWRDGGDRRGTFLGVVFFGGTGGDDQSLSDFQVVGQSGRLPPVGFPCSEVV